MDFRSRNQSDRVAPQPATGSGSQPAFSGNQLSKISNQPIGKSLRLGPVVLLFSLTALVIALTFLLVFGGNGQIHAVQKDKYQAVFLNNGQVYFGNIKSIGNKSLNLANIYYLQTSGNTDAAAQTQSNANVSLVKLGCELHSPYDQMFINSDQVIFWENLKDTGQVVKAIKDYKKTNTSQECSQQSKNSTLQAPTTSAPTPTPAPAASPKKP